MFHDRYWSKVSRTGKWISLLLTGNEDDCLTVEVLAKDFVKDLLEADPKKRCTASDALNHPVSRCVEFGLKQNANKLNDSG